MSHCDKRVSKEYQHIYVIYLRTIYKIAKPFQSLFKSYSFNSYFLWRPICISTHI